MQNFGQDGVHSHKTHYFFSTIIVALSVGLVLAIFRAFVTGTLYTNSFVWLIGLYMWDNTFLT